MEVIEPPDGDWPEQVTIEGLNITGPTLVMQMFDEVDLDDLLISDQPVPHTLTIWAPNRNPKKADTVQTKQRPKRPGTVVMFTPQG